MILFAALAAAVVGCNSSAGYAPVSGTVTLDGKPYGEAVVVFQPMSTKDNPNPGRGSAGDTDANGKFVLKTDDLKNGAVVGKHLVRIWKRGAGVVSGYDPSVGTPDGAGAPIPKARIDPIPPEWNSESEKVFEVPASGTDQANFEIVTKR
jgi:hypothetical protein